MSEAEQKPHISPTQLDMLARCGEQYRRRYMEREVIPPGISMIVGKSVHRGAEMNFRQKIESHEDLPETEIVDAAVAAFEAEIAGGYVLSDDEAAKGSKKVLGEAIDTAACVAMLHAVEQAPDYQPLQVEHPTRIVLPTASHDLLAVTDLRDDQERVIDFKTAKRRKSESEVHDSLQLTVYAAAYTVDHGTPPAEVRLDVVTTTKNPVRQILSSTRGDADFAALANRVNAALAVIQAGTFMPALPGSWWCSKRWCGYYSTCPYVNASRGSGADD